MASKGAAVGSVSWIAAEKENAFNLLRNEKEEVIYPAQHQLEWLNEHMAEIFNKSHLDVANVFKTPGKLRGKTPRTARRRNAQDARIPLSDVFSSKPLPRQSPPKKADQLKLRFEVAIPTDQIQQPFKSQTDSGYHTASQDDVDVGTDYHSSNVPEVAAEECSNNTDTASDHNMDDAMEEGHRTTEGSFHSAKEDQTTKMTGVEVAVKENAPQSVSLDNQRTDNIEAPMGRQEEGHPELDDIGSPSDESTPERLLVRKSSLTFASLPAREPLKSSIGTRISRTSHIDQVQRPPSSAYGLRPTALPSQTTQHPARDDNKDVEMDDADDDEGDSNIQILGHDDSESENQVTKDHAKFSTQRLHEKIDMLGRVPPPRPSKSIPSAIVLPDAKQPGEQRQKNQNGKQTQLVNEDDDDWIKPLTSPDAAGSSLKTAMHMESESEEEFDLRAPELIAHDERMKSPIRMSPGPGKMMPGFGHTKSASTATLASPAKASMAPPPSPAKSISVSNPAQSTTTPHGSPRRYLDLSASKSKLQSIMKTAKGLFTSSASISAAAKLETLSPHTLKVASNAMPGMYPNLNALIEDKPLPANPPKEARKTRSSTEREREEKRKEREAHLKQRMDEQLEKAREEERKKVAEQKLVREQMTRKEFEQVKPSSPKRQTAEQQEPIESAARPTRPIRVGKEHPINKAKPAPVSIRVGTLSQRMPASASQAAPSTQETLAAEPKRPRLNKKASTASLQSSTSTTLKSSVHAPPKPRALLAAERKKEQDEREAQRKLDQKRELERKRAAQQEEARKQEQRQRAEAEKRERERVAAEQAKRQAQQQAIERKRQETARKAEQQRLERAANEAAQIRPSSRLGGQPTGRSILNHPLPTNPAKPAKRPLEEEQGTTRPQNSKYGVLASQGDTKRRKTEEETVTEAFPRPVVSGAPIRQSQLGKKTSIFNHGTYTQAQSSTYAAQFPQPPSRAAPPQMQQYATGGKIPFADAPNPPAHTKTPVSIMQQKTIQTVKSSPQYPNGEAIHLPEIPTDSEDEDSDDDGNAFPIPDWASPGHLTEQLIRQEGMDGDVVFGPIAPLKIEEIFSKGNKDRLKRLRDRTSSANWALSGDGLTLEEVRADREQRERMRLEGGWRYGN
ncbi:uncharacterized protein PV07_09712 [Cladophialophora immunda]|uniref:Inner centromere protein ARK-binding domain-containing protein n=1 Tax=Cladophialophora immunda TaxID=569365 RepID=A0A0D2C0D4_9EURO|nr:uncharacterized protein PV07_09712 [Cladophialophora immunda]KIW23970.1 hypothetical protein PV07_09712 [Cladophialophora immunda]OQV08284.1 Inner centromere protein, ARK binding domain-containing protein [Cladophialophora immunda]